MTEWNSKQYLKFKNERTQPAIDLAKRIDILDPGKIIDIGCGPGNSTKVLANQFKGSYIQGIDSSENMINTAKKDYPEIDFTVCDASKDLYTLQNDYDIVFSNACIQWIPDHRKLITKMMDLLHSGGVLAVQIPVNYNEPIHQIIKKVSTSSKWNDKFTNHRAMYNLSQSEYFDVLSSASSDFTMWETVYFHRMSSHQSIMEWYKGTGLRPYLEVLSETDKVSFEKEIYDEVVKAYPVQTNGEIIFRFPRLFFIAVK